MTNLEALAAGGIDDIEGDCPAGKARPGVVSADPDHDALAGGEAGDVH